MILILSITKIFDKICTCNLVCRFKLTFPSLFSQKFRGNRMFLRFF